MKFTNTVTQISHAQIRNSLQLNDKVLFHNDTPLGQEMTVRALATSFLAEADAHLDTLKEKAASAKNRLTQYKTILDITNTMLGNKNEDKTSDKRQGE